MSTRNAVIFDLDDTLYPERRFALSGFAAVSAAVGNGDAARGARAFRVMARALRRGERARALQALCETEGLPLEAVPRYVDVIRSHQPALRLPRTTMETLLQMRRGWWVGVLTNGRPDIQARKVAALGLTGLVDAIVYAADHGSGRGKPDPEPFAEVAARLGVRTDECVFVGDDPICDIAGARRAGMLTIRVLNGRFRTTAVAPPDDADALAPRLAAVPFIAAHVAGRSALCA